jgi:5-methylcytosine-specific restriction endonuclease McrA
MAITKKLRFEVFKRDNFTCRYCGRKTPEVILLVGERSGHLYR